MTKEQAAKAFVKANDKLTKAKNEEIKTGEPVPQELRDELRKAREKFESYK